MAEGARSGIDGLADELEAVGLYLAERVPAYRNLLTLIGDALAGDVGRRLAKAWARRSFTAVYDRPLLLLATLRFDALREGPDHPLWQAVAAGRPDPGAATAAALAAALDRDPQRARVWHSLTRRRVQTNEVSRSVAWLWPATRFLPAGTSMALCDLGASAGLNLVADAPAIGLGWTASGAPLALATEHSIAIRRGFDRTPLDVTEEEDADWLRACIWPGEGERLDRLERAIAAFRAARAGPSPPLLETIEAADIPARLRQLAGPPRTVPSRARHRITGDDPVGLPEPEFWLAYQTVVREYLGPSRDSYLGGMRDWLAAMPRGRALWVELETPPDGGSRERPAAIIGHARGAGGAVVDAVLARCEYHPSDLALEPAGAAALADALGR